VYVLTVLLAATSFETGKKFQEYTFVGIVFVIIGFLLNPVRRRMQRVLDELLFPARVHFRTTSSNIRTELRQCLTPNDVYGVLTDRTLKALSFETFALYSHAPKALILVASHNGNFKQSLPFSEQEQFHVQQINAGSIPAAVNFQRSDIVSGDSQLLENLHCSIYVPLIDESKTVLGIAAGTPSIISGRFTEEEVDLLITICAEAAETLSRLLVQERMIIQHEERRRFEELSNLKSYFVSSVSHELRTPLTSIRMFAEMLRTSKTLPPQKRSDYLHIIQGESERLSRLVDNVLDFAKIERGEESYHFREVDLKDIVRRAVYAVQYQVEKQDIVLTVSFSRNLPRLYADADALEEVVINLLSNALKYSAGPSLRGKRKSIRVHVKRLKHLAVIEVADRGIGIPKREIQNIFGKFYRVNDPQTRQAGGAGLGLALVKHIIEFHGGDIEVRSTLGKGSTFTITLPLKQRNTT
jgi:signal transduction histidine kinase